MTTTNRRTLNATPDGQAIARLRAEKGWSQESVAAATRISERSLREIERRDRPFPRPRLQDLATHLSVPIERILKAEPTAEIAPHPDPSLANLFPLNGPTPPQDDLLQLTAVKEALGYWDVARTCQELQWTLAVTPTRTSAPLIDEAISITTRTIAGLILFDHHSNADEFDRLYGNPDVHRLARLGEVLKELEDAGVVMLSNVYFHIPRDPGPKDPGLVKRLRVLFAPPGTEKRMVVIDRGRKGIVWAAAKPIPEEDEDVPF